MLSSVYKILALSMLTSENVVSTHSRAGSCKQSESAWVSVMGAGSPATQVLISYVASFVALAALCFSSLLSELGTQSSET